MIVTFSLGGSLVNTKEGVDHRYLEEIRKIVKKSKHKFAIVTGGGYKARVYANKIRSSGGNEFDADSAAIKATWQNARSVIKALGKLAYPRVCKRFERARDALKTHKVVVMGGTIPGITTDSDAVLLAECVDSKRLINISNVDGIYNKNPKKYKNAKKYSKISHEKLIELAAENDKRMAGTNFVFDILASKLSARSKIVVHFVSGKNLDDLKKAIDGKKHSGTVVK